MYTKYYRLKKKPFENTPNPHFLFLSKKHREVLASLIYGINSAKGFILVAGDIGTGKTTLIHALLKEINPSYIIIHVINPRSTFSDLLSHLAKRLGVDLKGKDNIELIDMIRRRLEILDQKGKRAVLIIDEAHLLSEMSLEDIRLLSNIENERRKLLQIVLVGQNEIYSTLQKNNLEPLKQRLVINRTLEPLNKKETQAYIGHRLRVSGSHQQFFEKKALSLIWNKSRGIPRLINQICDNALVIGYALEARTIGLKIIKEVINDMEAGQKYKKYGANLLFRKFKWLGVVPTAVLLIAYLATNFIDNPLELPKRLFRNSVVSSQPETVSQQHSVNLDPAENSSPNALYPENKGEKLINVKDNTLAPIKRESQRQEQHPALNHEEKKNSVPLRTVDDRTLKTPPLLPAKNLDLKPADAKGMRMVEDPLHQKIRAVDVIQFKAIGQAKSQLPQHNLRVGDAQIPVVKSNEVLVPVDAAHKDQEVTDARLILDKQELNTGNSETSDQLDGPDSEPNKLTSYTQEPKDSLLNRVDTHDAATGNAQLVDESQGQDKPTQLKNELVIEILKGMK
jgi:type II secretory pathway predicted ATPase ExeA